MVTERMASLEYTLCYMKGWLWLPLFQPAELMHFSKMIRSAVALAKEGFQEIRGSIVIARY